MRTKCKQIHFFLDKINPNGFFQCRFVFLPAPPVNKKLLIFSQNLNPWPPGRERCAATELKSPDLARSRCPGAEQYVDAHVKKLKHGISMSARKAKH